MIQKILSKIGKKNLTIIGLFFIGNLVFAATQFNNIRSFFENYNTVKVYFAKEKLHRAQPLGLSLVASKRIKIEDHKPEYYTTSDLRHILNYVMHNKVAAGKIIKKSDLTIKNKTFIRKIIKDGYRSVILNVEPFQFSKDLVGGWRVDVTLTELDEKRKNKTTRILCALKVLDIGKLPGKKKEKHYIVLESTQKDALELLNASKTGTLNFLAISRSENNYYDASGCNRKEKLKTNVSRGVFK